MWTTLLLSLVLGASLGIVGDRLLGREQEPEATASAAGPQHWSIWFDCEWVPDIDEADTARWRAGRVARLRDDVGLDAEQVAHLDDTLERHDADSRVFWRLTRDRYCEIRDSMRGDIRALLLPEQRPKFEERMEAIDRHARERWSGGQGKR
jgi:hypothetical protein